MRDFCFDRKKSITPLVHVFCMSSFQMNCILMETTVISWMKNEIREQKWMFLSISLSLNINEKQLVCLKCQLFILLINYCFLSVSTYSLWIHPKVCGVEFLFYYCLFDLKFKFWTKSFISTFTANKWFIDEIATLAWVFVIQNVCVVLDNMSWFPTQINHLSFHGNGFHLA